MGLADRLHLSLTVEAPVQITVQFPALGTQLGPFHVHDHYTPAPQLLTPQRRRWQQNYTLEAETAGTLTIPALTVRCQPEGADNAAQELHSAPYPVTVTAVAPPDADVQAPKDIAPPVSLERPGWLYWKWLLMVGGALVLLGAGWWWFRGRRRAPLLPPPQPAHVVALEALQRLQRDDLIGQQRVEAFYVRLSAIVRHYIEWRFGLHAAEQTSEEFLAMALTATDLLAAHRELLSTFLEHCDLVKFARHQPTVAAMQQAFDSARTFITRTGDMQAMVSAAEANV
jgi:hypothetical protein